MVFVLFMFTLFRHDFYNYQRHYDVCALKHQIREIGHYSKDIAPKPSPGHKFVLVHTIGGRPMTKVSQLFRIATMIYLYMK